MRILLSHFLSLFGQFPSNTKLHLMRGIAPWPLKSCKHNNGQNCNCHSQTSIHNIIKTDHFGETRHINIAQEISQCKITPVNSINVSPCRLTVNILHGSWRGDKVTTNAAISQEYFDNVNFLLTGRELYRGENDDLDGHYC